MSETYRVEKDVKVAGAYDVVVCGGGPAGFIIGGLAGILIGIGLELLADEIKKEIF